MYFELSGFVLGCYLAGARRMAIEFHHWGEYVVKIGLVAFIIIGIIQAGVLSQVLKGWSWRLK